MRSSKTSICKMCCAVFENKLFSQSFSKKTYPEIENSSSPKCFTVCEFSNLNESYDYLLKNHTFTQNSIVYCFKFCFTIPKLFSSEMKLKPSQLHHCSSKPSEITGTDVSNKMSLKQTENFLTNKKIATNTNKNLNSESTVGTQIEKTLKSNGDKLAHENLEKNDFFTSNNSESDLCEPIYKSSNYLNLSITEEIDETANDGNEFVESFKKNNVSTCVIELKEKNNEISVKIRNVFESETLENSCCDKLEEKTKIISDDSNENSILDHCTNDTEILVFERNTINPSGPLLQKKNIIADELNNQHVKQKKLSELESMAWEELDFCNSDKSTLSNERTNETIIKNKKDEVFLLAVNNVQETFVRENVDDKFDEVDRNEEKLSFEKSKNIDMTEMQETFVQEDSVYRFGRFDAEVVDWSDKAYETEETTTSERLKDMTMNESQESCDQEDMVHRFDNDDETQETTVSESPKNIIMNESQESSEQEDAVDRFNQIDDFENVIAYTSSKNMPMNELQESCDKEDAVDQFDKVEQTQETTTSVSSENITIKELQECFDDKNVFDRFDNDAKTQKTIASKSSEKIAINESQESCDQEDVVDESDKVNEIEGITALESSKNLSMNESQESCVQNDAVDKLDKIDDTEEVIASERFESDIILVFSEINEDENSVINDMTGKENFDSSRNKLCTDAAGEDELIGLVSVRTDSKMDDFSDNTELTEGKLVSNGSRNLEQSFKLDSVKNIDNRKRLVDTKIVQENIVENFENKTNHTPSKSNLDEFDKTAENLFEKSTVLINDTPDIDDNFQQLAVLPSIEKQTLNNVPNDLSVRLESMTDNCITVQESTKKNIEFKNLVNQAEKITTKSSNFSCLTEQKNLPNHEEEKEFVSSIHLDKGNCSNISSDSQNASFNELINLDGVNKTQSTTEKDEQVNESNESLSNIIEDVNIKLVDENNIITNTENLDFLTTEKENTCSNSCTKVDKIFKTVLKDTFTKNTCELKNTHKQLMSTNKIEPSVTNHYSVLQSLEKSEDIQDHLEHVDQTKDDSNRYNTSNENHKKIITQNVTDLNGCPSTLDKNFESSTLQTAIQYTGMSENFFLTKEKIFSTCKNLNTSIDEIFDLEDNSNENLIQKSCSSIFAKNVENLTVENSTQFERESENSFSLNEKVSTKKNLKNYYDIKNVSVTLERLDEKTMNLGNRNKLTQKIINKFKVPNKNSTKLLCNQNEVKSKTKILNKKQMHLNVSSKKVSNLSSSDQSRIVINTNFKEESAENNDIKEFISTSDKNNSLPTTSLVVACNNNKMLPENSVEIVYSIPSPSTSVNTIKVDEKFQLSKLSKPETASNNENFDVQIDPSSNTESLKVPEPINNIELEYSTSISASRLKNKNIKSLRVISQHNSSSLQFKKLSRKRKKNFDCSPDLIEKTNIDEKIPRRSDQVEPKPCEKADVKNVIIGGTLLESPEQVQSSESPDSVIVEKEKIIKTSTKNSYLCENSDFKNTIKVTNDFSSLQVPKLQSTKATINFETNGSKFARSLCQQKTENKNKIGFYKDTNGVSEVFEFKCHLCHEVINSLWPTLRNHFKKKHSCNYELFTLGPKLIRCTNLDSNEEYIKKRKKRKHPVESSLNVKKSKYSREDEKSSTESLSGTSEQSESIKDDEGQYKCKKCDKIFPNAMEVRMHIFRRHRIARKNLICLECGENFIVMSSFQMHLKSIHEIEDPQSYIKNSPHFAPDVDHNESEVKIPPNQCHVCMAVFEGKRAVNKHLRVHGITVLNRKDFEVKRT